MGAGKLNERQGELALHVQPTSLILYYADASMSEPATDAQVSEPDLLAARNSNDRPSAR